MEQGLRFAAIDIGSNAIRLLFSRIIENDNENPYLIKESLIRMPLRLGHDVFNDGQISNINCKRFIATMEGFSSLIDAYSPISYRACATAAMRNAKNGLDLVKKVKSKTGLNIEIINGSQEASLILSKNINSLLKTDVNYMHIDVGGGSTELSIINNGKVKVSNSFPIGSVRLLQNKVNKYSWDNMRSWIEKNSAGLVINKAIGSGGNINKMASILGKKKGQNLSYASIKRELKKIKSTSLRYRIVELGMRPDRADVIEHASKIYLKCMKWVGARKILVPQSGLADGLIEQLYKKYKLNV